MYFVHCIVYARSINMYLRGSYQDIYTRYSDIRCERRRESPSYIFKACQIEDSAIERGDNVKCVTVHKLFFLVDRAPKS